MSEKNQAATPRRLERAHREGQVARSRLGPGAAALVAGGWTLSVLLPDWWRELQALVGWLWSTPLPPVMHAIRGLTWHTGRLILPVAGVSALAALTVHLTVTGWHPMVSLLTPRPDRISPVGGFKRLFSGGRWIEPVLSLLFLLGIGGWFYGRRGALLEGWHRALRLEGAGALATALVQSLSALASLAGLLLVIACVEAIWARHRHAQSLRMSTEEVKREHRQSEGDPQHKAQRRALHRQFVTGGSERGVAKATAVVINPTHLAVALRYAPDEHEAPYVVAKGRAADAKGVREEAQRLGIPIVRDVPLARSLIPLDVGEAIPEELYRAAAVVLAHAGTSTPLSDVGSGAG
ncbi:MAG TPA: EscU/YscU/HrcU family type III secretion system export apparatus switch protein [Myxococcaceae bacterium]|nr:EscU/YscU/HrcU family type III secretion system export apparatus switch protein [Myxococcaceae bacterium]